MKTKWFITLIGIVIVLGLPLVYVLSLTDTEARVLQECKTNSYSILQGVKVICVPEYKLSKRRRLSRYVIQTEPS